VLHGTSRAVLRHFARILAPVLFAFGLPENVCRHLLVGDSAPKGLVDCVRAAVSRVPAKVLAHRLRSVLSCSAERDLQAISVPLLYVSGLEDRLVRRHSFDEIQQAKPDVKLASVQAPHLILQANPQEAVHVVLQFLRQVRGESDRW
jgi:pimeloyl-ACP methyl ester carboxylesterase